MKKVGFIRTCTNSQAIKKRKLRRSNSKGKPLVEKTYHIEKNLERKNTFGSISNNQKEDKLDSSNTKSNSKKKRNHRGKKRTFHDPDSENTYEVVDEDDDSNQLKSIQKNTKLRILCNLKSKLKESCYEKLIATVSKSIADFECPASNKKYVSHRKCRNKIKYQLGTSLGYWYLEYSDTHVGPFKKEIEKLLNTSLSSSHVRFAFSSSSEYATKSGFIVDNTGKVRAALIVNDYHFKNTIMIDLLVTQEEYRGLGLASLLVLGYQYLMTKNKEKGYKLHVKASDSALDFWFKDKFCFKAVHYSKQVINTSTTKNQGCVELEWCGDQLDVESKFLKALQLFQSNSLRDCPK